MAAVELTERQWDDVVAGSPVPLVALFWAEWCMPCRSVMPYYEVAAARWEGRARLGKIDADANRRLVQRLDIRGLPTLVVFRGGQEVARRVGLIPEEHLQEVLEAAVDVGAPR